MPLRGRIFWQTTRMYIYIMIEVKNWLSSIKTAVTRVRRKELRNNPGESENGVLFFFIICPILFLLLAPRVYFLYFFPKDHYTDPVDRYGYTAFQLLLGFCSNSI